LVALRRLGTVEDCAKVVEFLATDLSDYVTGAVIPIDGGLVRGQAEKAHSRGEDSQVLVC
jgi:NAD(P)-dependent dehydrogenase (short-subunit alcohol dehydrogenase family)